MSMNRSQAPTRPLRSLFAEDANGLVTLPALNRLPPSDEASKPLFREDKNGKIRLPTPAPGNFGSERYATTAVHQHVPVGSATTSSQSAQALPTSIDSPPKKVPQPRKTQILSVDRQASTAPSTSGWKGIATSDTTEEGLAVPDDLVMPALLRPLLRTGNRGTNAYRCIGRGCSTLFSSEKALLRHVREYHYGWPGGQIGLADQWEARIHYERNCKFYVQQGSCGSSPEPPMKYEPGQTCFLVPGSTAVPRGLERWRHLATIAHEVYKSMEWQYPPPWSMIPEKKQ
ncbi:hypothetical protein FA13DRAFT_1719883 [Coprinellus micaceus]|uniref:C2H2-type domain-containing protein n=1 Tax=Coprinellus micaceus TaxID=71717 RepID=A0A4Y7SA58_COPMI|nr:hypothetical protein FA13DRAFT_1719883 [Coprinellus micaceus]